MSPKRTEIDLWDVWPYILYIAKERLRYNKTVRHIENDGTYEILGAAGELAARRFLRMNEKLHIKFDHGADLLLFEGTRKHRIVNVKATHWDPYHHYLLWPTTCHICCDIAMSTLVDIPNKRAKIAGWTTSQAVANATINPKRDQECHEIRLEKLLSPYLLFLPHAMPAIYKKGEQCTPSPDVLPIQS